MTHNSKNFLFIIILFINVYKSLNIKFHILGDGNLFVYVIKFISINADAVFGKGNIYN